MDQAKEFPPDYIARISELLGHESGVFFESLSQQPILSVRVNPLKPAAIFESCESVAWCREGKYLTHRPSFTLDPLFHAGTYYVQEASSMFLSEIFRQLFPLAEKPSLKVLDLCASPGGKSTLMLSEISPGSLLVANETIHGRIAPLFENLVKWGAPNFFLTGNDPGEFSDIKNYFDVILVDAPCSGEGLFRKDGKAVKEWSEDNVRKCASRQKRILSDISGSLKENGILIYCTCTFSGEENEENAVFAAADGGFESVKIDLKEEWNIYESVELSGNRNIYSYRFYPHRVRGEGFFVSVLKKSGGSEKPLYGKYSPKKGNSLIPENRKKILYPWLREPEKYEFTQWGDKVFAVPAGLWEDYLFLSSRLNMRLPGICIGKIVNETLVPSHQLALSSVISENIESVELEREGALDFLRRGSIMPLKKNLTGWALVKYSGYNLGWIKILDHRINNYFPKELRILKS